MKKIIFVTPQFKNGGGNRVFVELANSIIRNFNHDIEISFPNNSEEINHYKIENKININKIGSFANNSFQKLFNVILLYRHIIISLKKNEETIIVISDPILCVFLWVIPCKYKKKVYRFIQADDYKIYDDLYVLKNRFFLFCFKSLTLLNYKLKVRYIFNSTFTYRRFIEVSKRKDVPKTIVHPAVDNNVFYSVDDLSRDKISISLIARDHPLKKLDDFITVWSELSFEIKSKIESVFLISTDKLEKFDLKDFKLIRPINDFEIAEILRKSDIFISTSLWEGFSLPPLEAINCGAVILSSDSGGINEYAVNTYNSLLYKSGELKELKSKLIELIENPELRRVLRENSLNIIKEFSWDKSAKNLISIID